MNLCGRCLTAVAMMGFASQAYAHPGHGSTPPDSPLHHVVEPVHSGWIIALLVLGVAAVSLVLRNRKRSSVPVRQPQRPQQNDG